MIPTITDYELPTAATSAGDGRPGEGRPGDDRADAWRPRVDWHIEPNRAALLVHDLQQYFIDAYEPGASIVRTLIDNTRALRDAAEAAGMPVIFTAQPPAQAQRDRRLLTDFWGPGLQADGREAIVDELQPVRPDQHLTKWRYDAFRRTDLQQRLADAGRDQLIITGVYAHIGCLLTASSAFMLDIQPFLVADALADFSADYHRLALTYAAERCGVVTDASSVLDALAPVAVP